MLEAEFETAKKRVEFALLTEAIGLALRKQRLNLPSADQYVEDSDLKLSVFILGLAGIWVIWEPVFPAFSSLQDI